MAMKQAGPNLLGFQADVVEQWILGASPEADTTAHDDFIRCSTQQKATAAAVYAVGSHGVTCRRSTTSLARLGLVFVNSGQGS
jgi:hypothetical protein